MTLKFTGHETFHCRHFWLKKGYDFLKSENDFKDKDAVVDLGVGKNMITSIAFWLKAFGLTETRIEQGKHNVYLLDLSEYILDTQKGKDPYLEDLGTVHLLHYLLQKIDLSSIYGIVFGEFRKSRVSNEFTASQLNEFLKRKINKEHKSQQEISERSVQTDIKVFLRMYECSGARVSKNIEDDFSTVLLGINMVSAIKDLFIEGEQVFKLEYNEKEELDPLIFLYAVKNEFENESSITLDSIQNNVSDLFLCNREGTEKKLEWLQNKGYLVYKQDAGRKEIQIKDDLSKFDVLNKYYGNN